jgi:outer membrane protein OmpA-like peptidoglycan-associated protein
VLAERPRRIALTVALLTGLLLALPLHEARRDTSPVAAASAVEPYFRIAVRRDRVLIAGHSPSLDHEARVREAAGRAFPGLESRFEFRPLGLVPDWWENATGELVAALAQSESPTASLSPDSLRIAALVDAGSTDTAALHGLRNSLPPSVEMHLDFAPSGSGAPARAACARHFANFDHGAVNFEESGTTMRSSAMHVLDRVVALADACRDALVSITGHTDSSGNEALNRELSLARARAVAAHLASRGIAGERLLVHGAGSSVPIADNTTRYGRSLNRRIVIGFSYPQ